MKKVLGKTLTTLAIVLTLLSLLFCVASCIATATPADEFTLSITEVEIGESLKPILLRNGKAVEDVVFELTEGEAILENGTLRVLDTAIVGSRISIAILFSDMRLEFDLTVKKPTVRSISVALEELDKYLANHSYNILVSVTPELALIYDDITYSVECDYPIYINGNTLTIPAATPYGTTVSLVASIDEYVSQPYVFTVSTVVPTGIAFPTDTVYYQRGDSYEIPFTYYPSDADTSFIQLTLATVTQYATLTDGILSISQDCPKDLALTLTLAASGIERSMTVIVTEEYYLDIEVPSTLTAGSSCDIIASANPSSAITSLVAVFLEGGDIAVFNSGTLTLSISPEARVDSSISFFLTSDQYHITSELVTITIEKTPVRVTNLIVPQTYIEYGESIFLIGSVLPINATYPTVSFAIISGAAYATLEGNVLTARSDMSGSSHVVEIYAVADGVRSEIVQITIIRVAVNSVELTADGYTVKSGGSGYLTLTSLVFPENATMKDNVEYVLVDGEDYCYLEDNKLFAREGVIGNHNVKVKACADGIDSDILTVTVIGYYTEKSPTSWDEVRNLSFSTSDSIAALSLVDLEGNTGCCTIVVPNTVKELLIIGNKEITYKDLFVYYENRNSDGQLALTIQNLNIEIASPLNGYVFDFGETASINFSYLGENSIKAGSPTAFHSESFTATESSMPLYGANGADGGICIYGATLRITGEGSLTLYGGNGADGTDGKDGYDDNGVKTTAGGDGGLGGNGGEAILGNSVTISVIGTLTAYSGNAGTGGKGGLGSTNGAKGQDGTVPLSIISVSTPLSSSGSVRMAEGRVTAGDKPYSSLSDVEAKTVLLGNAYGIVIKYGNSAPTSSYSDYPMTSLTDGNKIRFMLEAVEYALLKLPKNIWREIKSTTGNTVTIGLVNTIGSSTLGLTNTTGSFWLAYRSYVVPRSQFHTTLEQTALHEMLHILSFTARDYHDSDIISDRTYRSMNGGLTSRYGTGEKYVYYEGETGDYCFMTRYGATQAMEDVSETLSLAGLLPRYYDCFDDASSINVKMRYMIKELKLSFYNFSSFKKQLWERWI